MSYWRLYYHFVWGTKKRLPFITPEIQTQLYASIAAKAQDMEAMIHAIGGIEDHVHLAVSVPPKIAVARFIGEVKGSSSHFANHVLQLDFKFLWQDEYGVLSFGTKNLPFVVNYIRNQRQHHAENKLHPDLERVND